MTGQNLYNEPYWDNAVPGPKTPWTLDVHSVEELVDYLQRRGITIDVFKLQRQYLDNLDTSGLEWLRELGKTPWTIAVDSVEDLRDYLQRRGISIETFKQQPQYKDNLDTPGLAWLRQL